MKAKRINYKCVCRCVDQCVGLLAYGQILNKKIQIKLNFGTFYKIKSLKILPYGADWNGLKIV